MNMIQIIVDGDNVAITEATATMAKITQAAVLKKPVGSNKPGFILTTEKPTGVSVIEIIQTLKKIKGITSVKENKG